MPFIGLAFFALMSVMICGAGVIVAAIGRRKKSRLLIGIGLAPIGIALTLVLLATMENYLPLDWRARLHMSLPSEARVIRYGNDMDRLEIVFRLPSGNAQGFNEKAFQTVWQRNIGSYTYPCPGPEGADALAAETLCGTACAWGGRDPDCGERRLVFDRRTRTYCYSAR